ncbi:hypothetical protein BRDI103020_08995 [Brevundimonas diminuta]
MDRMAGIYAVVDLPNPGPIKQTVVGWKHHLRVPAGPDPTKNGYACRSDEISRINGFGYSPESRFPGGVPIWKIKISHHRRPYRSEPWRQPCITSERLVEFCDANEIDYVFIEGTGIEVDLDFASRFIDRSEKRLETVKPWLEDNLWVQLVCACGRKRSASARDLFGRLPAQHRMSEALNKLRCMDCGKASVRQMTPLFEHGLSALDRYRRGAAEYSQPLHRGELDGVYENVGGDGVGPVYLGDGVTIGPDGTLSE